MGLKVGTLALAVAAILLGLFAASASAALISVTPGSGDAADLDLNDPTCDADPGAGVICTVRAAVQTANSVASPGADEIEIPAGSYTITIAGQEDLAAAGDLDITTNLEIRGLGAGATINGPANDRIFHVPSGVPTVKLSKLRITGALNPAGTHGAGIKLESGSLTVTGSEIDTNFATGPGGFGGGIYASGAASLKVLDSTIHDNHASFLDQNGQGGGIYSVVPTELERVAIFNNETSQGCAPALCGGAGGGLAVAGGTLTNVSIVDNTAWAPTTGSGAGGGIYHLGTPLTILSSTIADNTARGGVGIGGGNIVKNDDISLRDTIVANGLAPDQGGYENCDSDSGFGTYLSLGHNLESMPAIAVSQCGLTHGVNGDLLAADPGLDMFGDHGGDTFTYSLEPTSPAVNAGSPNGPVSDQRGVSRPQGAACDIGAFELEQPGAVPGSTCAGPPGPPPATSAAVGPTGQRAAALKKCKKKKSKKARKKCKKRALKLPV